MLVQVTVVPAFTVSVCGLKVKLSIDMAPALAAASLRPAGQHDGGQHGRGRRAERGRDERAAQRVRDRDIGLDSFSLAAACR